MFPINLLSLIEGKDKGKERRSSMVESDRRVRSKIPNLIKSR